MAKIVFLDAVTVGDASLEPIVQLGEFVAYPLSDRYEALERVRDADILIVNKVRVDSELLDAAPSLKLVCEAATGLDNIDLAAAAERGILVRNVSGYSTDSVAQLTFTQILTLLGAPYDKDRYVKSGDYSRSGVFTKVDSTFPELSGRTIGIIGMGKIGSKVASIASAFGMNVVYYSTSGTSHCTDWPSLPLDELLHVSDVVSIHCPLNDRTKALIGASQLTMMKKSAVILNMARGPVVDEKALADAISGEVIAGAAVDVYSSEPALESNPLLHTSHPERLLFTPHIGWASREAVGRLVDGIALNIRNFLSDSEIS